jgi:hypothetical protein
MVSQTVVINGLTKDDPRYYTLMDELGTVVMERRDERQRVVEKIVDYKISGAVHNLNITISSKNDGIVQAVCEQFLVPVSQDLTEENIKFRANTYRRGVAAGLEAEASQKKR